MRAIRAREIRQICGMGNISPFLEKNNKFRSPTYRWLKRKYTRNHSIKKSLLWWR